MSEEEQARRSEEARLQAAFMEQAFRTLQEWERAREEMARWQRELKLPDPVDWLPCSRGLSVWRGGL